MYVEMPVPHDSANLNDALEDFFNNSSLVGRFCDYGCQTLTQAENRSRLSLAGETEFFIVILSRAVETLDGFKLVKNRVTPTNDVFIR